MDNAKNAAFTLIELLIVIGILAILMGVLLSQFTGSSDAARAAHCLTNLRQLAVAAHSHGSRTESSGWPLAGSYIYERINVGNGGSRDTTLIQGWIGHKNKGDSYPSCYYASQQEYERCLEAVTNGTLWTELKKSPTVYVCPAHLHYCKQKKGGVLPMWSYKLNGYFGYDKQAGKPYVTHQNRGYGKDESASADRRILFAEIPFNAKNGALEPPEITQTPSVDNDPVLRYTLDGKESGGGTSGFIGFNHKTGGKFFAHVVYCDGHAAKLMMPGDFDISKAKELTGWLCGGKNVFFDGRTYKDR